MEYTKGHTCGTRVRESERHVLRELDESVASKRVGTRNFWTLQ